MDTDDDTRAPDRPQPLRLQWVEAGTWHRAADGPFLLIVVDNAGGKPGHRWRIHLREWQPHYLEAGGPAPDRVTAKRMAESMAEALAEVLKLLQFATPKLAADPVAEQLTIDQPTTHTKD